MKLLRPGILALIFFTGCLFDSNDQVAGAEDFPNTITPLGKIAADDISSHTNWDQFQSIDTTPNLAADSLTVSVSTAAKLAVLAAGIAHDTTLTWKLSDTLGVSLVQHVRVNNGDGKLATKSDNRVKEYDLLRSRLSDTLEWTQLTDAGGDGYLWGSDSSGVVDLRRQVKTPLDKPQVLRVWSTLKARIYHFGKTSTVLSYTERCAWQNGDTTVFTTKGIRLPDSLLIVNDTSLVTYDRTSLGGGSSSTSKARYWVRLGKLVRPFADNALLRFEIVNRWNAGIIRYDSIAFMPDSVVLSRHLNIHGSFMSSARDSAGASSQVAGFFRNDSIQADMHETRDGKNKNYHMVYDADGMVKTKDTLPDGYWDEMRPRQFKHK